MGLRTVWLLVVLSACGGGGDVTDYMQQPIPLDQPCQGVTGLTGQSILDQKHDQYQAMLGYITAQGMRVDVTMLTIDLTWPSAPTAVCYPAITQGTLTTAPRVAIEGLRMHFKTADGKFDETLDAKAWRVTLNGAAQNPSVGAVTTRGNLKGTWQPFPDYTAAGSTMTFFTSLSALGVTSGNVGMGAESTGDLEAGIFKSRFAAATW